MQDHRVAFRRRSWVWACPLLALLVVGFTADGRAQGKNDDWIWSVGLRAQSRGESSVFWSPVEPAWRLAPDRAAAAIIGRFARIREIDEFCLMPYVTLPTGRGRLGGSGLEAGAISRPYVRMFTSGISGTPLRVGGVPLPRIVRRAPESARGYLGLRLHRGLEWRFSSRWVAKIGGEWSAEKAVSRVADDDDRSTDDRGYSVNLSFAVEI